MEQIAVAIPSTKNKVEIAKTITLLFIVKFQIKVIAVQKHAKYLKCIAKTTNNVP